jgi:hypothetical protein
MCGSQVEVMKNIKMAATPSDPPGEHFTSIPADYACAICTAIYDADVHIPNVLSCLHVFCSICIPSITAGTKVTCPTCFESTTDCELGSESQVIGLQCHYQLQEAVEVWKFKQLLDIVCEVCNEEQAMNRCFECEECLCPACSKIHLKFKLSSGHDLQQLEDFRKGSSQPGMCVSKPIYCTEHPSVKEMHELTLVCSTCDDSLICMACTVKKHKDHDICFISELSGEVQQYLATKLSNLESRSDIINNALGRSVSIRAEIESTQQKLTEKVYTVLDVIQRELECRVDRVLSNIHAVCENKVEALLRQEARLSSEVTSIQTCAAFSQAAINGAASHHLMHVKPLYEQRLDYLSRRCINLYPVETADMDINLDTEAIFTAFKVFGTVQVLLFFIIATILQAEPRLLILLCC